jgi:hypothetical protein
MPKEKTPMRNLDTDWTMAHGVLAAWLCLEQAGYYHSGEVAEKWAELAQAAIDNTLRLGRMRNA